MNKLSIMKKIQLNALFCAVLILSIVGAQKTNAQGFDPQPGFTQLDFGTGTSNYGIPIYVGMDFGVGNKITIGPRLSFSHHNSGGGYNYNIFNILFRADYHWGAHISGLPSELDLYGGLSAGYSVWNEDFDGSNPNNHSNRGIVYAQVGARWYFSETWGVNAEISGGATSGFEVGMSVRF